MSISSDLIRNIIAPHLYIPKTAIITGATSGFGYETALMLDALGCRLILTGRREERLNQLQDKLQHDAHLLVQDIRDTAKVTHDFAAENLPQPFKDIDLLINNAGLALGTEPFNDKDVQDSLAMVETNINGVLNITHAVLPGMVARKKGHIINIGSIAGNYAYPGGNTYGASKAFINHFSRNLRSDLKGKNIRVSNIEPGAIETEFSTIRFKGDQEKADKVYQGYRHMVGKDIAQAIIWIATQPEHINIGHIEITPTDQSLSGLDFTPIE